MIIIIVIIVIKRSFLLITRVTCCLEQTLVAARFLLPNDAATKPLSPPIVGPLPPVTMRMMTIRIFDNDATENKILRTVDQVLMKSNNFWKLHLSFDITMYLKGTWIVTTVGKPQHLYDRLISMNLSTMFFAHHPHSFWLERVVLKLVHSLSKSGIFEAERSK